MKNIRSVFKYLMVSMLLLSCSNSDDESGVEISNETGQENFELWTLVRLVTTVNGADLDEEVIARFDDGTVTKDMEEILDKGNNRDSLRNSNPASWGTSRIIDGKLEVHWDDEQDFDTFFSTFKLNAAPMEHTFTDCFKITGGISTGFGGDQINSFSIEQVFFDENGQFSFQSSLAINGGGTNGFSRSSDLNGTYVISGNQIELAYENGKTVLTTFGFSDESTFIGLGNDIYYNCD